MFPDFGKKAPAFNCGAHNLEISLTTKKCFWQQVSEKNTLDTGLTIKCFWRQVLEKNTLDTGGGSLDEKFSLRVRLLWWENNLPINQIIRVFLTANLQNIDLLNSNVN